LLVEEFVLTIVFDTTSFLHLFVATLETSVYTLDDNATALDLLELPLNLQHAPVGLDGNCGFPLLLAVFLCLAKA
jgi:hypothetical protein